MLFQSMLLKCVG